MSCPRCGSENVSTVSSTHTYTQGYGCCRGALGALLFGSIGWLCGLCGMGRYTSTRVFRSCNSCGYRFR